MFCSQDIPKLERASRPVVQVLESPQPVITFFSRRPARRTLWSPRCPWRTSPGQLCRAGPSCLSSRSGGGQRCEGMRDFSCSGRWGSRASRSRPAAGRGPDPVVLIPVFASLSSFCLCHHPHRHPHLISWPEYKQRQMPGSPRTRNALHRSSCCDAASDLLARPVRLGNPSPAALVLARAAASYNTEWSSSLSDRPAALSHCRRAPSAPSLRSSR